MKKIFRIENKSANQRLDKFLIKHWPDYSRAHLQKQIKTGAVLVNDQIKKSSYILKAGDKIETSISPSEKISLEPDPSIKFKIIYENNDVIVIDKPAGLTAHPSATQKNETLVNGLLAHYPPLSQVGDDPARPGLVHRLDKDTSGLMIIAKNNSAFLWLKKQFAAAAKSLSGPASPSLGGPQQEKEVTKKYIALVVGHPEKDRGEIKTLISRSKSNPTKQMVSRNGKEAITLYRVIKKFHDFALIEAQPKTGRMHQIRVHLSWLGNPVAGDKKYGLKKAICPPNLERQFLHATQLEIKLPSHIVKKFYSPLPDDLQKILDVLK